MTARTHQFTAVDLSEQRRRTMVRLITLLFLLLIFEGALRKWVLPALSSPLLFIRDPFLLAIYFLALQQNRVVLKTTFHAGLVISGLLIVLALLQVGIGDIPLAVGGYGIRNYVLYLPLPFVMATTMQRADTEQLIRVLLLVSIPLGALGVIQSYLPVDHFLNKGVGDGMVFTAGNQARTYGTFSFTAGHGNYINAMLGVSAGSALFFSPGSREKRYAWPSLFSLSCAAMTSGSRGVIVGCVLTLTIFVLVMFLVSSGRNSGRMLAAGAMIAILGIGSFFAFSDQYENIAYRFESANEAEGSIIDRGLSPITRLGYAISDSSLLGVGVGKGTGGGSFLGTGVQELIMAEDEPTRVLQECGVIVGSLYMGFRFLLFGILVRYALHCLTQISNPLPIIMLPFLGTSLILGQITLNNTSNGFNWLFVGLLFACCSLVPSFGSGAAHPAQPGHR